MSGLLDPLSTYTQEMMLMITKAWFKNCFIARLCCHQSCKGISKRSSFDFLLSSQVGTCSWIHSIDQKVMFENATILAKFAAGVNMPDSMETNSMQGEDGFGV